MSWLMRIAKDIGFGFIAFFLLATTNLLASVAVVLVTFTILADTDLFSTIPVIPVESQVSNLTLLGMNAFIILVLVGSWFTYKLVTLFDTLDFSFDTW